MVVAILIYNNSILKIYIKSQRQIISQLLATNDITAMYNSIDKVLIVGKLK